MNGNPPKVSIVVNSFKDLDKLKLCVDAIKKTRYDNKEVIVVSYGIPERAIKTSNISSSINKLILLKKDLGPPAQRNIGFKTRDDDSKYVLFVDDDVLLTELAIENLIRVLEMFPLYKCRPASISDS
ncbi:MAG: glycosyltransferase [Candidatus Jordarchaeaceae archaeon]